MEDTGLRANLENAKLNVIDKFDEFDIDIKLYALIDDSTKTVAVDSKNPTIKINSSLISNTDEDELYKIIFIEYGKFLWENIAMKMDFYSMVRSYEQKEYPDGSDINAICAEDFSKDLFSIMNENLFSHKVNDFIDELSENPSLLKSTYPPKTITKS